MQQWCNCWGCYRCRLKNTTGWEDVWAFLQLCVFTHTWMCTFLTPFWIFSSLHGVNTAIEILGALLEGSFTPVCNFSLLEVLIFDNLPGLSCHNLFLQHWNNLKAFKEIKAIIIFFIVIIFFSICSFSSCWSFSKIYKIILPLLSQALSFGFPDRLDRVSRNWTQAFRIVITAAWVKTVVSTC